MKSKEKHAVLLLHGLAGSVTEMGPVKKRLSQAGFAVSCPTLPGHGMHYSDLKKIPWQRFTDFAAAEFEHLEKSHDTVSVSGLCLGAVLSLHLGINYGTRVRAIAPVSTTLFYDGWGLPKLTRFIRFFRYTPLYWFYNLPEGEPYGIKNPRLRQLLAAKMTSDSSVHYSKIPFKSFWQMKLLNEFVRPRLKDIRAPVFAIHPMEDDVASIRNLDFMEAGIKSDFHKLILYDSYHLATIDQEKDLVSSELLRFFTAQTSGSPR